ncbi:MAG: gluconate 2-dehydrogenase subunit 3 family protein [Adhaeribacter sp.]|nr:gluconate 2-dehydrogenase subunit 3 family protein [Adhaeribacter sp.]
MKRRSAVKNLTLAVAGLVSLPAWASGWSSASLGPVASLTVPEESLLAEIVETIIPETDTPGAKSLKVHQFVMRMITDCYGSAVQGNLEKGLLTVDQVANGAFNKAFSNLDTRQRTDVLTHLQKAEDPATQQFISLVKNLTIRGYLNSEYVQLNLLDYKMAPGFYHGCVAIES